MSSAVLDDREIHNAHRPVPHRWYWMALCVFSLAITGLVLWQPDSVLNMNTAFYSLVAERMLHGETLYVDIWDHKPPGIFGLYCAARLVAPQIVGSILLLTAFLAVVTMFGVYLAISNLTRSNSLALFGAALWGLVFNNKVMWAGGADTEAVQNLIAVWCFVMVSTGRDISLRRSLLIGLAIGIGSIFKQTLVVLVLPFVIFSVLRSANKTSLQTKIASLTIMGLAAASIWLMVLGIYAHQGHLREFIDANFIYNRFFAGSASENLLFAIQPAFLKTEASVLAANVFLFLGYVASVCLCVARPALYSIILAYMIGAQFASGLTGMRLPNYEQLLLVPTIISLACLATIPSRKSVRAALLVTAFAAALLVAVSPCDSSDGVIVDRRYSLKVGREWGRFFPNDKFYAWDKSASLFYTQTSTVGKFFFPDHCLFGPDAGKYAVEELQRLQQTNPVVIFIHEDYVPRLWIDQVSLSSVARSRSIKHDVPNVIYDWLVDKYRLSQPNRLGPYIILSRRSMDMQKSQRLSEFVSEVSREQ